MAKRLTAGEKRAARRPGVGGKKPGLWPNVWKKRARKVRKSAAGKSSARKSAGGRSAGRESGRKK